MGRNATRPPHRCPARRCPKMIRYHMLMCPEHWRMVPKATATQVWHEYHEHGIGSPEHRVAILRAIIAVNIKLWRAEQAAAADGGVGQ